MEKIMTRQGPRALRMQEKLETAFAPLRLEVVDDSARHAGHPGLEGTSGGETHFRLHIISADFTGLSRVDRQRRVHDVLQAELNSGLHALSLLLQTPHEAGLE